jgi:DNA-binding transcriptional ArsR family regulator
MCRRRIEPSLDELFGDIAMQLLMRRDGVSESDVRALLGELRDARAVRAGATARECDASIGADQIPDREKRSVSSQSSDARTFPIRFI